MPYECSASSKVLSMQSLEGLFVPLVTPFTDDGSSVSEIRFARQIRYLLEEPVQGFVVASDCGEFTALSGSERKQLVEWAIRMSNGSPVLVNVSTLSTAFSVDLAQHADRHGARAVIVMPPYYGAFTPEEIVGFIRNIAHYGHLPTIVVDPQELVTEEIRLALQDLPDLILAHGLQGSRHSELSCHKGVTTTDEFAADHCVCSPLALLRPKQVASALTGSTVDLAKLIILEETLGRNRVSKAGLEALGLEMGNPRPPLRPIAGSVHAALKTLLSG